MADAPALTAPGVPKEETGMTAKETIKTRLDRLRQQSRETGQVRLSASAVTLAIGPI